MGRTGEAGQRFGLSLLSGQRSQEDRERLWVALADLFLDTETRWFLPRAAAAAVVGGFSWSEVRQVLEDEVTPVVGCNLLDVAGEWAGFEEGWLLPQLRARQTEGPPGVLAQAGAVVVGSINRRNYGALESLHGYLRPREDLKDEEGRLSALARLCLEPQWTASVGFWSWTRLLSGYSLPSVDASMHSGILPAYVPLLVHEGDPTEADLRANWERQSELLVWLHKASRGRDKNLKALEELSLLFRLDNLANVARGPMVLDALHTLKISRERAEQLFRGPLTALYGASERAEQNWQGLFPAGSGTDS